MPRKQITSIFQKVSNLPKISILLAKITRKPVIPKLIALKKSRKLKKKFNLLKHHNYEYIQEYQLSRSNSPLICYRRKPFKKRSQRYISSIFFLSKCLGRLRDDEGRDGNYNYPMDYHLEALHAPIIEDAVNREFLEFSDSSHGEEEDSVDERAERFIRRFYREMRIQKKEARVQLGGIK